MVDLVHVMELLHYLWQYLLFSLQHIQPPIATIKLPPAMMTLPTTTAATVANMESPMLRTTMLPPYKQHLHTIQCR